MIITGVSGSAKRAGVRVGETLISVNGNPIFDILDVLYQTYEENLTLELRLPPDGKARFVALSHKAGEGLGLTFAEDVPGGGKTCKNDCVFCFTAQNPPNCRASLLYKDDDARLSFLLGNYITLTNLEPQDIEKICKMRLGPLGISVHTTNPELRSKMLRNNSAGNCLEIMRKFASSGISMNAQIVLCPGINDGAELERTLYDLMALGEAVNSTSIVPVGLTAYRENLTKLRPVTKADAVYALTLAQRFENVWCSDEIYLLAGIKIPKAEYYKDFPQLQNGVGMLALFADEFEKPKSITIKTTIATGELAAPFLRDLLAGLENIEVVGVRNNFFGFGVTVAGLVTGGDLLAALEGRELGERVLIPKTMLKHGEDVFLDDMSLEILSTRLGVPVIPIEPTGTALGDVL